MACGLHWEARRRQQFLDRRANAFSTRVEGPACMPVRATLPQDDEELDNQQAQSRDQPLRDHDCQEFSFQDVRPQTAAAAVRPGATRSGTRPQSHTAKTGNNEDDKPYHGYPKFMEYSMDHFGRHDQFTRWLHDDFLAPMDPKEQQVTLHRANTDEKYRELLKKKFALTQERKARDNGFYMS